MQARFRAISSFQPDSTAFRCNVTPSPLTVCEGGSATATVAVQPVGSSPDPVAITSSSSVATATGPATIAPGASAPYNVTATGSGTLTFIGKTPALTQN